MQKIVVEFVLLDNRIQYKLILPKQLKKYFLKDTMFVQYDSCIDWCNVPTSVLAIPVVSVVLPIAWAVGTDVSVFELDTNYIKSLERVKAIFRSFKSKFAFSGDIMIERKTTNEFGGKRTCLLFGGGVDSLTSCSKHKHEKPDLISIWGVPDIPVQEREFWNAVYHDVIAFAHQEELNALQIKTDMITSINNELLQNEFGLRWFISVISKLTLTSLCAPITASRGIGTIFHASSHTEEYDTAKTGFLFDSNTFWADVKVVHDCFELSRQQKLRYLCLEKNRHYLSHLRVCNDSSRAKSINCGMCEKCLRTIIGLLVEGVDPRTCNIDIKQWTLAYAKECFEKGKIGLGSSNIYFWRDIQRHIPKETNANINGSSDFLKWFSAYDLSGHRVSRISHTFWRMKIIIKGGRLKTFYLKRKIKCYFYIILTKLKLI